MSNQTERPDLRVVREHVLVHPEIEGTLRIQYHDNSFTGIARFKGKTYETSLKDVLKQGWIHYARPDFTSPLRNAK